MNENRTIAEENLRTEPELIDKRAAINTLSEEGVALCAAVQEKLDEISKCLQFSPQLLIMNCIKL